MFQWKAKIYYQERNFQYELEGAKIPFCLPDEIPEYPKTLYNNIRFADMVREIKSNPKIRYITNNEIVSFETDKDLSKYSFVINNIKSCGKMLNSYIFRFQRAE